MVLLLKSPFQNAGPHRKNKENKRIRNFGIPPGMSIVSSPARIRHFRLQRVQRTSNQLGAEFTHMMATDLIRSRSPTGTYAKLPLGIRRTASSNCLRTTWRSGLTLHQRIEKQKLITGFGIQPATGAGPSFGFSYRRGL